jgi:hypothetical protein
MNERDEFSTRLAELGARTAAVRASSGFADRVMFAVGDSGFVPGLELLRSARRLLPLAIVAALLSAAWALESEQSSNRAIAASESANQELDW